MFRGERWVDAFLSAPGENAEAAFSCLKALVPPVKTARYILAGRSAARGLERLMRESFSGVSLSVAEKNAAESALRFVSLLIEKDCFKYVDSLLEKIESRLDRQKGILTLTVESAVPMDSAFTEEFGRRIAFSAGAPEVKIRTSLVPELIGGYRLRIGKFLVDASLKGQIENMTAELAAMPAAPVSGGGTQNG